MKSIAIPGWISADGRGYTLSAPMEAAIERVADRLRANRQDLAASDTQKEWRSVIRSAFAPALNAIDLDANETTSAEAILASVRGAADRHVAARGVMEFALPCTLFSEPSRQIPAFGAVKFCTREGWLAEKHLAGVISTTMRRRIERAWSGAAPRKRSRSEEVAMEWRILASFQMYPYVCVVETRDLAIGAAEQKAVMAARLALLAIALAYSFPARALAGLNLGYDGAAYHRQTLVIAGSHIFGGTSLSKHPHGPWADAEEWASRLSELAPIYQSVGEVLAYSLSATEEIPRAALMRMLLHAMLFYHEGCREELDLLAVVKFGAALDALAQGKGENKILALCMRRLAWKADDRLPIGEDRLKTVIDRIYRIGRSRTLHGNNPGLRYDWADTRLLAEWIGRNLLLACLRWAAENSDLDATAWHAGGGRDAGDP